tara:strand:- start:553 stop:888 length:336 start_codon:yes stop_codon:yes gene_type:complete
MFKKIIRVVFFIPVAIILLFLSIANREPVSLALNPFDPADTFLSVSAPFFVFIFITLMIGMILGSVMTWFAQGKHRQRARQVSAESDKWHTEADRQKEKAENLANQMISQS